jgi:DNA-binding GntR family transcriptional regulator
MRAQPQRPVSTELQSQLRQAILCGELIPGERLRLESLQQTYGRSSTPIREALTRLTAEGLAELEDRRGFRVAALSETELREISRLRLLFEGEALRESMARGDDEWEGTVVAAFHRLAATEKRMPALAPTLSAEWYERHRDFHMSILRACSSPKLLQLCSDYFLLSDRYRRVSAKFRATPRSKNTEHKQILQAVISRDVNTAIELLTSHIQRTADSVAAILRSGKLSSIPAHEALSMRSAD